MTIKEVYEKFKHLDKLLSDESFLSDNRIGHIAHDLWQAIKEEVNKRGE